MTRTKQLTNTARHRHRLLLTKGLAPRVVSTLVQSLLCTITQYTVQPLHSVTLTKSIHDICCFTANILNLSTLYFAKHDNFLFEFSAKFLTKREMFCACLQRACTLNSSLAIFIIIYFTICRAVKRRTGKKRTDIRASCRQQKQQCY